MRNHGFFTGRSFVLITWHYNNPLTRLIVLTHQHTP